MSTFTGERAVRAHSFFIDLPVDEAFRLFEPEGERDWAQGWDPHHVFPASGRAERGMVFTTTHGQGPAVWMVTRYEPQAGMLEYVNVVAGIRSAMILVQCAPVAGRRTRATVVYTFTGLGEEGNAFVRGMDETRYATMIGGWENAIREFVARAPRG